MTDIATPAGLQSPVPEERRVSARTLKIEAEGDPYKGLIKPKIRLVGRWLEEAGFTPGHRVQVTCLGPGVIELRSPDNLMLNDSKPPPSGQADCPF
jgi:hypothetical protein